ncbi:Na+/H+ antiporter NhaA [Microbacterium sp. GXF7504]
MTGRRRRTRDDARTAALVLLAATAVAIGWANVPGLGYAALWQTTIDVGLGGRDASFTLHDVINDALMTVFFFAVGLDVKREFVVGELTTWSKAVIPVVAAVAGLTLPALVFLACNVGEGGQPHAWAAVISSDTAFLLGALALVGPRVPGRLRAFLLGLSVVDDIGALSALAVFYTGADFRWWPLPFAAVGLVALWAARRLPVVWRRPVYALLWVGIWLAVAASGIEPTLAGVAIALVLPVAKPDAARMREAAALADALDETATPAQARRASRSVRTAVPLNDRMRAAVAPWTSFVILPLFALANAGFEVDGQTLPGALASPLVWGVVAGLVVGKTVGVFGSTVLLRMLRIGDFGAGIDYRRLAGGSALCGIGFTISLYVVDIAVSGAEAQAQARIGVLVAGVCAFVLGALCCRLPGRRALVTGSGRSATDPPAPALPV